MAGKRIYDTDPSKSLAPLSGAQSANNDKLVIFDVDANETKRIDRSQLAAGLVGDLPYTPSGGISATTIPTAIAELDSEAAKSATLAATGGAALIGTSGGGTVQSDLNARPTSATLAASGGAALIGASGGGTVQDYLTTPIFKSANISTTNAVIDSTVSGSLVIGTYAAQYTNKVGVNNTKPLVDPTVVTRTNDTAYTAGVADVAAILGGYDNVNNALAGMIASQHSMLYTGADHASIFGGSLHTIYDDTDYSVIVGGTNCAIEGRGRYGGIYNSESCLIETGPSDSEAGFRATIIGSAVSTIGGRNGVMLGSVACTIQATYGSIFAGETITLTNGSHMGAGGANITMGNTTAATYSFAWGNDHIVDGSRALVFGDGHRIGSGHDYTVTTGYRCLTPFIGARVHSGRQRGNTVGNNMGLDWTASQETTDTTTTRLSAAGTANFPTQPADSIVNGTVWVTGVSDAGVCSTFRIDFTSERVGTGTATLRANTTTTVYNGLSLGTVPTMNTTTGGIYRVQVVGLAATNIRWDARFTGQQVVYG